MSGLPQYKCWHQFQAAHRFGLNTSKTHIDTDTHTSTRTSIHSNLNIVPNVTHRFVAFVHYARVRGSAWQQVCSTYLARHIWVRSNNGIDDINTDTDRRAQDTQEHTDLYISILYHHPNHVTYKLAGRPICPQGARAHRVRRIIIILPSKFIRYRSHTTRTRLARMCFVWFMHVIKTVFFLCVGLCAYIHIWYGRKLYKRRTHTLCDNWAALRG